MRKKIWLIIAIVHWIISFFTDNLVFTYENIKVYSIWKGAFLLFLLVIYGLAGYLIREYSAGNSAIRKIFQFSVLYALVMVCFLLLTWPGIWRVDEFNILLRAKSLRIHFWQGYLTSVYYIFALMMVPTPVFVVLFQCLISSGIVGYLIYKLWIFTGKKKIAYLLYIPFLFFPVIDSNLYPMRMSIYAFLELLLSAKVCFWNYEKKMPGKSEFIGILLLAGVVTCWRTESIYYLLLFPILLGICLWKIVPKKQVGRAILIYLCFGLLLVGIQKVGEGKERGERYELTAIIRPLVPLLQEEAYQGKADLVKIVDNVVNCAYIFEGVSQGMNGIEIFWAYQEQGLMRDTYSPEEYREYQSAFLQLVLRHPKTFLKERMENYLSSTKLLGKITDREAPVSPLNERLRYGTYAFLECRSFEDYHTQGKAAVLMYTSIVPSLFLAAGVLLFLRKKSWVYAGSMGMVLLKVPLIFLTAPEPLFMYYYSVYLCGWVFLFGLGILWFSKRKESTI